MDMLKNRGIDIAASINLIIAGILPFLILIGVLKEWSWLYGWLNLYMCFIFAIILGLISFYCGVFTLLEEDWYISLSGGICALLTFFPPSMIFGVIAIILIIYNSRK
jgi:hypothetical protein